MAQHATVSSVRSDFSKREFSKALSECVLDVLKTALGKTVLDSLISHFAIDRHADDPAKVHADLRLIFADGARVLEKLIVRELFRRLNLILEGEQTFDFEVQVDFALNNVKGFRIKTISGDEWV